MAEAGRSHRAQDSPARLLHIARKDHAAWASCSCQASRGPCAKSGHRQGLAWGHSGVTVGSQDSQGLVPQGLQFAPVLLTELLCPLSCVHGFWLAGHSSFHHLPTAERSSKLGQRQQGLRAGAGWWGFAQLCWGTLALLEPQ